MGWCCPRKFIGKLGLQDCIFLAQFAEAGSASAYDLETDHILENSLPNIPGVLSLDQYYS